MKLRPHSNDATQCDRMRWRHYGFAALMLLLAQIGRWLLDPHIGDAMPLSTMYVAVALTVCIASWQPAVAIAFAGYFIGLWLFVSPRLTFKVGAEMGWVRAGLYTLTCTIIIVLCETIRRSRKHHATSEAKLLSILENMHESFCSVDSEWRITSVNRSAEDCLGRSRDALVGHRLWEVLPACVGSAAETQLRLAMREGTPVKFETGDFGDGKWHSATATRVNGELSIFFEDITAKRAQLDQLERLVDDRTAAMQRVVAELEAFSYTLVHDMRAPLRSIAGFVELLSLDHASQLDADGRRHLARIQRSAARMDQLIVDILDYSQLTRQQPELRPVNLDDVVRDIIASHDELRPDKADVEVESTLPVVRGNDALLTQCFSNLLNNATKFVRPGTRPRIRIRTRPAGEFVRVEVVDNGIGVAPDAVARIFEPFRREHPEYDGTGIGLAIVQKVVEQLGGRVGVESEPEKGSRFWVELRLAGSVSPGVAPTHAGAQVLA